MANTNPKPSGIEETKHVIDEIEGDVGLLIEIHETEEKIAALGLEMEQAIKKINGAVPTDIAGFPVIDGPVDCDSEKLAPLAKMRDLFSVFLGGRDARMVVNRAAAINVLMLNHRSEVSEAAVREMYEFYGLLVELSGLGAAGKWPSRLLIDGLLASAQSPSIQEEIERFVIFPAASDRAQ